MVLVSSSIYGVFFILCYSKKKKKKKKKKVHQNITTQSNMRRTNLVFKTFQTNEALYATHITFLLISTSFLPPTHPASPHPASHRPTQPRPAKPCTPQPCPSIPVLRRSSSCCCCCCCCLSLLFVLFIFCHHQHYALIHMSSHYSHYHCIL